MIRAPDLVHYVCIAKDTTILAEFNSKDAALGEIAVQCLGKAPPFHATYTHTVRSRTYAFLIDERFVYFSIFDENLENAEGLDFLRSVKAAFDVLWCKGKNSSKSLDSHCFQGEFNPVLHDLLKSGLDHFESLEPPSGQRFGRSKSNGDKGLMKMKNKLLGECNAGRVNGEKENDEEEGGVNMVNREVSFSNNKQRGFCSGQLSDHHKAVKARKIWKKQVWIILSLDFLACFILFVIWLWVCSGFKCMDT